MSDAEVVVDDEDLMLLPEERPRVRHFRRFEKVCAVCCGLAMCGILIGLVVFTILEPCKLKGNCKTSPVT